MSFVNMNILDSIKNTVYIHGTNDKIASAYLGAIDNTPRYNNSTFDYRVYLTKSLGQTTSLDESLFSIEYLYKNKIDAILTDTFKLDVLYDNNRSIEDIYTDLERVYANNAIGIFDLSTCFYTTPLTKEIPLFTTIEQETLENYYKDNKFFESAETDEILFNDVISKIDNVDLLPNIEEFNEYIKKNYLKYYRLTKRINDIYFNIITNMTKEFYKNTNDCFSFYDFTTTFGITSDKYRASKIVNLYNYIIKMQKLISYTLSNHKYIEDGLKFFDDINEKFPINYDNNGKYNNNEISWEDCKINGQSGSFTSYIAIDSILIAGSGDDNGLYYSEDNGKTWNQSNIISGNFDCLITINNIVIAGSYSFKGLYYSEDNGKTWTQSNNTNCSFHSLITINNVVIAGSTSKGLYYSEDNGKTWNKSNITNGSCYSLTTIDNIVVAGSGHYSGKGLYYSEDNGKTWTQSNITNNSFHCLITINNTVIAGNSYGSGLYYSEDNGKTWTQSNITNGYFGCLSVVDNVIIAGSNSGLYYSEDNGKTWNESDNVSGNFDCLITIGSTVIAGSGNHDGLYYSEDNGKTWILYNDFDKDMIISLAVFNDTIIVYSKNINGVCSAKYSKPVDKELIFNIPKMPNLYNVLWSIVDTRLSKISTISQNTEMFNYFSCELIHNNIIQDLKDLMILGTDLINPLTESSKNGKSSEDENNIDKVYSVLTENYSKVKLMINSLLIGETKIDTLKDNNEFIIYLYISVMILITLMVVSSSSTKNKVFQTVDFDTIMQVLGIDYQKTYSESDILDYIATYQEEDENSDIMSFAEVNV